MMAAKNRRFPAEAEEAGEAPFRPLHAESAAELRRRILTGEFPPGSTIPERETAASLGISRTPLREALRILSYEGLVSIRPARSPVVANPSLTELTQLFYVLSALEALAGEQACIHASEAQLDRVEDLEAEMRELADSADRVRFFEKDMEFHAAIVQASCNRPLIETHRQYNARLWRARYMTSTLRKSRQRIMRQHQEMVAALRRRDLEASSTVLRSHLRSAVQNITALYQDPKDPGADQ